MSAVGGGGTADVGYSCTEEWVTLTDESVTTEQGDSGISGVLAYSTPITANTIKVTFNGTEYTCGKAPVDEGVAYGGVGEIGPDFSNYPFAIFSNAQGNNFYTETAGTYQIKVVAYEETIETTECFDKARGYRCTETYSPLMDDSVTTAESGGVCVGALSVSGEGFTDTIKVTFDGAEYECQRIDDEDTWGAPLILGNGYDWSTYPFNITIGSRNVRFYTQTAGTYQVKIEALEGSIETSECFAKAVNKVVEIPEPTASLSKATLVFEIDGQYEPFDRPHDGTTGRFINADVPTLNDMLSKMNTTEYYAEYDSLRMPLTYIDSSKAQFTAFEQKNVQSTSYIRHHIITYNSGGSVRWDRYDIAVPTSY